MQDHPWVEADRGSTERASLYLIVYSEASNDLIKSIEQVIVILYQGDSFLVDAPQNNCCRAGPGDFTKIGLIVYFQ